MPPQENSEKQNLNSIQKKLEDLKNELESQEDPEKLEKSWQKYFEELNLTINLERTVKDKKKLKVVQKLKAKLLQYLRQDCFVSQRDKLASDYEGLADKNPSRALSQAVDYQVLKPERIIAIIKKAEYSFMEDRPRQKKRPWMTLFHIDKYSFLGEQLLPMVTEIAEKNPAAAVWRVNKIYKILGKKSLPIILKAARRAAMENPSSNFLRMNSLIKVLGKDFLAILEQTGQKMLEEKRYRRVIMRKKELRNILGNKADPIIKEAFSLLLADEKNIRGKIYHSKEIYRILDKKSLPAIEQACYDCIPDNSLLIIQSMENIVNILGEKKATPIILEAAQETIYENPSEIRSKTNYLKKILGEKAKPLIEKAHWCKDVYHDSDLEEIAFRFIEESKYSREEKNILDKAIHARHKEQIALFEKNKKLFLSGLGFHILLKFFKKKPLEDPEIKKAIIDFVNTNPNSDTLPILEFIYKTSEIQPQIKVEAFKQNAVTFSRTINHIYDQAEENHLSPREAKEEVAKYLKNIPTVLLIFAFQSHSVNYSVTFDCMVTELKERSKGKKNLKEWLKSMFPEEKFYQAAYDSIITGMIAREKSEKLFEGMEPSEQGEVIQRSVEIIGNYRQFSKGKPQDEKRLHIARSMALGNIMGNKNLIGNSSSPDIKKIALEKILQVFDAEKNNPKDVINLYLFETLKNNQDFRKKTEGESMLGYRSKLKEFNIEKTKEISPEIRNRDKIVTYLLYKDSAKYHYALDINFYKRNRFYRDISDKNNPNIRAFDCYVNQYGQPVNPRTSKNKSLRIKRFVLAMEHNSENQTELIQQYGPPAVTVLRAHNHETFPMAFEYSKPIKDSACLIDAGCRNASLKPEYLGEGIITPGYFFADTGRGKVAFLIANEVVNCIMQGCTTFDQLNKRIFDPNKLAGYIKKYRLKDIEVKTLRKEIKTPGDAYDIFLYIERSVSGAKKEGGDQNSLG